jgi:PAS domain S-box-containing protein
MRYKGPRVVRFIGVSTGMTGRRVAEHELEQLFMFWLDPMCIGTPTGNFLRVNPAWERAFGFTEAETQKMSLSRNRPPGRSRGRNRRVVETSSWRVDV